jgi:hypothetical protein
MAFNQIAKQGKPKDDGRGRSSSNVKQIYLIEFLVNVWYYLSALIIFDVAAKVVLLNIAFH